jgi:hypothetical protein
MRNGLSLADPAFRAALEHQPLLSVADYHRMIAAGIFGEDDGLELLEGVIVEMSPQRPRHARIIRSLCDPQFVAAGPSFVVQAQLPLTLGPDSEPEPEVAVVLHRDPDTMDCRYRAVATLSGPDRFQSATVSGFAFAVADPLAQPRGRRTALRSGLVSQGDGGVGPSRPPCGCGTGHERHCEDPRAGRGV